MKYLILLLCFGLSLQTNTQAKTIDPKQTDTINQLIKALGQGNAVAFAKFFPNSVAITVLQKTPSYYSKKQAEQVLADFFSRNTPRKFEITHEGGQSSSQFTIGHLFTTGGVFRISFFLQEANGQSVVQNLSIGRKED